jgi:hypothetical protein
VVLFLRRVITGSIYTEEEVTTIDLPLAKAIYFHQTALNNFIHKYIIVGGPRTLEYFLLSLFEISTLRKGGVFVASGIVSTISPPT